MININRVSRRIDYILNQKYPAASAELELALHQYAGEKTLSTEDNAFVGELVIEFNLTRKDVGGDSVENPDDVASIEQARDWLNRVGAYRMELESSRASEISNLYSQLRKPFEAEHRFKLNQADEDDFFSEPEAEEGLLEWVSMPTWTVDEAAALSLGKNPAVVHRKSLGGPAGGSPFRMEFRKRAEILMRAIVAKDLSDPLRPEQVVGWCHDRQVFADAFGWFASTANNRAETENSKKLHGSIEKSLRKLLVGMAVCKYGLSLKADNNVGSTVWEAISADLSRVGIKMHSDTVRTHVMASLKHAEPHGVKSDGKKLLSDW